MEGKVGFEQEEKTKFKYELQLQTQVEISPSNRFKATVTPSLGVPPLFFGGQVGLQYRLSKGVGLGAGYEYKSAGKDSKGKTVEEHEFLVGPTFFF